MGTSSDDSFLSILRGWRTAPEAQAGRQPVPDETLLAALREALAAREAVPAAFVEAGKTAYAWRNIDAELAQLTFDSRRDTEMLASMRSEPAPIRALTLQSARFTIEVSITDDAILGQLIPPQSGTGEVQTQSGRVSNTPINEVGCFVIEPKPDSPFRLRVRTTDQADVVTGWLAI